MPNNICLFDCNNNEKLSVFTIPKGKVLKNEWLKSLEVDNLYDCLWVKSYYSINS